MYESREELRLLQKLLDDSRRRAGKHLLEILKPATARRVCEKLVGIRQVVWVTVTSKCKPRSAPVDSAFIHGRFYLSTDMSSLRARHLAGNPATTLTFLEDITFSVVVHGEGRILKRGPAGFRLAEREFVKHYGREMIESVPSLVFIRVDPELMFAHESEH